ncbi:MAG: alpha/beta hydrolase [Myxococcota bacterium]
MRKLTLAGLTAHVTGGTDGSGGGDGPVVVLLHGFGAPGTDLLPLGAEIPVEGGVRFVFPMAPHIVDPYSPPDLAGRAWWMIDIAALQVAVMTRQYADLVERKPDGIDAAREKLEAFLEAMQLELAVSSDRCVLGGFSQGAMLATDTLLRGSKRYAGLLVLSGTLLTRGEWKALLPAQRGLPVLQSHGRADPILPIELAAELREMFVAAGLDVDWVEFNGGHGIPQRVLERAGVVLKKAFSAK